MNETKIVKESGTKLRVIRDFDAPVRLVWNAWTQSDILDQWWAPKPWQARTKSMDFKEGGFWLYSMNGPDGEQHWARADFQKIVPMKSYTMMDSFCDAQGVKNDAAPQMKWLTQFIDKGDRTAVEIEIVFDNEGDLEKIIEMGFKEGFTAAHGNLDELLASQLKK